MTPVQETVASLRARAQEEIGRSLADDLPEDDAEVRAWALLVDLVEEENRRRVLSNDPPLSPEERTAAAQELFNQFFRIGPLQPLLDDESIEEVVVNAPDRGFVVRAGGAKEEFHPGFSSDEEVRSLLARIISRSGRRIDDASPAVDVHPGLVVALHQASVGIGVDELDSLLVRSRNFAVMLVQRADSAEVADPDQRLRQRLHLRHGDAGPDRAGERQTPGPRR